MGLMDEAVEERHARAAKAENDRRAEDERLREKDREYIASVTGMEPEFMKAETFRGMKEEYQQFGGSKWVETKFNANVFRLEDIEIARLTSSNHHLSGNLYVVLECKEGHGRYIHLYSLSLYPSGIGGEPTREKVVAEIAKVVNASCSRCLAVRAGARCSECRRPW